LQRILESSRDVERSGRRIGQVELANVSDDSEIVWAVYSVDAVNVAAADVRADESDQCVRDVVDERDVDRPTDAETTDADDRRRQTAGERRFLPGLGSTREILPAAPSVTYSAPSGPMVLPFAPSAKPVTSRVAVGSSHGRRARAADGVIIAIRGAANISTKPMPTDFVTRIAGSRASARMFCVFMI
jgi:hypothetical protein